MTTWHEERLLIDGELVPAAGGATYETINPATEEVLGVAADATVDDARRAIAAARRAFDTTDWSRDHAFRVRCLRQLHQALLDNFEPLREILVQRGRRAGLEHDGPQLDGPTDVVGWYADLLEGYEFVEDLGERDTFAGRHHRWIEKEAAGVVGAIAAYNYPIQLALAKLAPALAAGCTVVLKGAPDTPWATLALGQADRRVDRHPARRRQRAHVVRRRGRRGADDAPRRRRRVVHRLDAGRPPDHGRGERNREARVPRARRQVGVRAARRRRPRRWPRCSARTRRSRTPARAARSRRASSCRATATTRSSTSRARCSPDVAVRRPDRSRQHDGTAHQRPSAREGRRATSTARSPTAPRPWSAAASPSTCPRASSTSRRCSPAPTRTPRSPRTSCSGRCSWCCRTTVTTTRCAIANNSIFGLSGAVLSADRERALGVARRIRCGTMSVNGGLYYGPDAPFGGYKQSGIGPRDGRGRARRVPRAQDVRRAGFVSDRYPFITLVGPRPRAGALR